MATVVVQHGNCSSATWQLQLSNMATEEGPDHDNRGGARGYWHAGRVAHRRGGGAAGGGRGGRRLARPRGGGEGRRPRRVVRAACSLARTCSCGTIALHRTCGLWLRAPGRGRVGGVVSVPHMTCGTTNRYTTRVAVIGVLFFYKNKCDLGLKK